MGFNLTNERIQDTYPQLLQISGSTIVDGTGSVAPILITSASYAVTASFALNGGGTDIDTGSLVTTSSFNAYTSSNDAKVDSLTSATSSYLTSADITGKLDTSTFNSYTSSNDSKVDALIAATSSYLTSLPSGVISSSAQIADDISGSFTSTSASLAADIATNKSNISTQTSRVDSLVSATSSYAVKAENNSFSGTQTFDSIAVSGTASIAYLQSVTGSAKIIGDAFIILNADSPTERYAGIKVYDSGSSPISTGSFIWDSVNNDWFYEYEKDATDYAVALFGPEFSTKGTPTYPTTNTIQKGTGGHHLGDSIITDDGSTVTVGGDIEGNVVTANTYFAGDLIGTASLASTASYVSAGNIDGKVSTAALSDTASYVSAVNIDGTVANATTASYALTSSAATTFTISTQLDLGSSVITVDSASATGSLIDNIHPAIASGSTAIKHIVTIDQTAYDTISGSSNVYDDTLYIISDASDNVYPNNLQVQGQIYTPTFAGTIASSTSSIDFDNGNFATLSLTTPTFLANPSNLKSGTTYTLIIDSGSLISNHGTAWKFAGGTSPTYSNGTDVLTCVSDGTSLYATALADFS